MVGLDLLDDEAALRGLLGERDFEALEAGVGDAETIAVDGEDAVFRFDGGVGLGEGEALFVEPRGSGFDLAGEAGGGLARGHGQGLEFGYELLVLLRFDVALIQAGGGFGPARLEVGEFAADEFEALALLGERKADVAEGVAAELGFGAG